MLWRIRTQTDPRPRVDGTGRWRVLERSGHRTCDYTFGTPVAADCVEARRATAELCESLGHDVVEAATLELARRGRALGAAEFLGILESFTATARQVAPFWDAYDVLLTPTLAMPPVANGYIYTDDPDASRYLTRWLAFVPLTPLANITGNPSVLRLSSSRAGRGRTNIRR